MLDINNVRKDKPSSFFKFHTIHSALEPWNKALAHWTMTTMMSLKFIKSREKKSQVGCQEVATFGATNVDVVCCFKLDFTERNTTFVKVFFLLSVDLSRITAAQSRCYTMKPSAEFLDVENPVRLWKCVPTQSKPKQSNCFDERDRLSERKNIYICEKKTTQNKKSLLVCLSSVC